MRKPFDKLSDDARQRLRRGTPPAWTSPMLATLTHEYFSDARWIFERKLDGVRLLAFRDGDDLRLMSRNRLERSAAWPEVAESLRRGTPRRFVLDGEVVAFRDGVTSFERLQGRMQIEDPDEARATGIAVYYYVFDLLHLDGYDVTPLGLRDRKRLLRAAFDFTPPVRILPHRNGDGEAYLRAACAKGWEGVIAKRADGVDEHSRSTSWLKFKCVNRQEFVIGGYTDPGGSRPGFGALLLGVHDDGDLVFAGKVGTGFDDETLESLGGRLRSLERRTTPFAQADRDRHVHWVTPKLVCEVGFTEWTADGKRRHPRFLGLRTDKEAGDVIRERPMHAS